MFVPEYDVTTHNVIKLTYLFHSGRLTFVVIMNMLTHHSHLILTSGRTVQCTTQRLAKCLENDNYALMLVVKKHFTALLFHSLENPA